MFDQGTMAATPAEFGLLAVGALVLLVLLFVGLAWPRRRG